ncbi:MAG: glycosyltransferase family 4 protein [Patescibacteria group bacterium]
MKIGIDARFWGHAGPGRYVKNLVLALEDIDEDNDYVVFLNSEGVDDFSVIPALPRCAVDWIRNLSFKSISGKILNRVQDDKTPQADSDGAAFSQLSFRKKFVNIPWYSFVEQIKLPFVFGKEKLDLLHVPHFNIPVFYPGKIAVTIHDLTIHRFSTARATTRWRPFNLLKRLIYKFVFWLAVKRAAVIFVPTEFVKEDLLEEYSWLDSEKIIVTYEGVGENFKLQTANNKFRNKKNGVLTSKYGVSKPYLLYVGSMYPHKNIPRLVKAFGILAEEEEDLSLVLVGKLDYFQRRLREEINFSHSGLDPESLDESGVQDDGSASVGFPSLGGIRERVVFPAFAVEDGYVPDEDLIAFYQNALAFVFPSLSEGFGLPPLEAMQFDVPVVAAEKTCIPEVCGNAAVYFDPCDEEDIVRKIKSVVNNSTLREELVENGNMNLQRFSWEKTARKTLAGYLETGN